uniref:Uncharacterized protein n=1 Tax=Plectus sambesii TaxID=2011161 RepID=A0A914WN03_9BILA
MEELYGALIAEKLIDQQLAKNLWDAGFQTVHSLMELPTDVKELRELLQHDCPALQKIGVAYSLVAAIKKLLSGEIRLDTVPKSGRQSTATFTIAHSEPSSITSEKAPSAPEVKQQLNEMHLTNDNSPTNEDKIAAVVTKRIERIESALRETISSIEALRESKPIQKYPALAKELRLDLHSSAISILQRRFKAMLDPVLLQFQSDAVDIDAVDEILDQFEKPLITESKLQETIECLREACSFLQEHLLDAIEQEGIPVEASETTTTTTTIALTLNMGRAQDENYESIKSFIDSSSPKAIFHWPREPTARKFFSKKVADFVSLYRINKSNGNVHFVCNLDSCIPSDSSLSNCRMAIFVQLIEPNRRTLLSLPMSVHPENILADEVTPSTMTLSWQDSMHSNLV